MCKGWIKLVLCPSIIGMMLGSNIVSVRRSSIKVLWGYLYASLYWEIDADLIVFEHQRRRRICFKEIVTLMRLGILHLIFPDKPYFSCNFLFFLCNFSFPLSFCFRVFANKFVTLEVCSASLRSF